MELIGVFLAVLSAQLVRDGMRRFIPAYLRTLRTTYSGHRDLPYRYRQPFRVRHALWMQDHLRDWPRPIRRLVLGR